MARRVGGRSDGAVITVIAITIIVLQSINIGSRAAGWSRTAARDALGRHDATRQDANRPTDDGASLPTHQTKPRSSTPSKQNVMVSLFSGSSYDLFMMRHVTSIGHLSRSPYCSVTVPSRVVCFRGDLFMMAPTRQRSRGRLQQHDAARRLAGRRDGRQSHRVWLDHAGVARGGGEPALEQRQRRVAGGALGQLQPAPAMVEPHVRDLVAQRAAARGRCPRRREAHKCCDTHAHPRVARRRNEPAVVSLFVGCCA